jgi:hypothetical protein
MIVLPIAPALLALWNIHNTLKNLSYETLSIITLSIRALEHGTKHNNKNYDTQLNNI